MRTDTKKKIIAYISKKQQASPAELIDYLHISAPALFKHLKQLVEKGQLSKIGTPPTVFYILQTNQTTYTPLRLPSEEKRALNDRYLYVSPTGAMNFGVTGFQQWCEKTNQPVEKTVHEYIQTLKKYDAFRQNKFIDGTHKFKTTFDTVYLDHAYYLDFYSIERFGKTKLGQLLLYAKQNESKKLIRQLITEIQPRIEQLIAEHSIDAVGFIPPTLKREIQFMVELKKNLHLGVPTISIIKVTGDIRIAQKSLSKLSDRIENARATIFVTEKQQYNNILLIDDAIGSGATLNETAKKIREQGLVRGKIIGLAITGSFKGFDVLNEV